MKKYRSVFICICATVLFHTGARADLAVSIHELQQQWAHVNYELDDKEQLNAFKALIDKSEAIIQQYPDTAESWIWNGIIKSSYAGAKGGLGALKYVKDSRKSLEKALQINDEALQGSAYTSLGTLYYKVPGWPIGFGDNDKAEDLLQKALALNPEGIDSNYFYAQFLYERGDYQQAQTFFLKAQQAPPRPQRPVADAGRHKEINLALEAVRAKLKND